MKAKKQHDAGVAIMNKIKTIISEILIVLLSYFRGKRKKNIGRVKKKTVLIPYANIFGDIVLFLDCIDEFEKIYPKEKGYDVRFICRPEIKKFLLTVHPGCTLRIETVDWTKFARDYSYYNKIIKKYNEVYDIVIVPYDHTVTNDFFVRSIRAREKISQDYDIPHNKKALQYILGCGTYTRMITVNKNISVLERQRILINQLGNTGFRSHMPYIRPLKCEPINVPAVYALICPTASYPPKRWPIEKFAEAADYLIDKYGCKICICAGNEEPDIFEKISSLVKHKSELKDYVSKTSFAQWAELIRGARIALCNDSAAYHLAAAVRTPAVCIAGDFACVNAPLYEPDIINSEDRIPLVLYKKMPCEGCRYIGYRYGYGNEECTSEMKKGNSLECIQNITAKEVIDGLESQIKKYNIQFAIRQ